MKAVTYDRKLSLTDRPKPRFAEDEALIRVTHAGICNTDHEIIAGYVPGFSGVIGHEFVGIVEESEVRDMVGKRVTAEINCACGACEYCRQGLSRHCPERTVLGIMGRPGAMAEYVSVPVENVVPIPDSISDTRAVFIEPLAAALEILEQLPIGPNHTVLLIGDGKLALLIAHILASTGCRATMVGKYPDKLAKAKPLGLETLKLEQFTDGAYDIVIEAAGKPSAFDTAVRNVKPRGTVVLKSTYADRLTIDAAPIVVNEVTLIGSRCGRFSEAIRFLEEHKPALEELISDQFPLSRAQEAFARSAEGGSLKVVLTVNGLTG